LLVTTFLTLILNLFSLQGKDASGYEHKTAKQFYETYDAIGSIICKRITQIQGHYFI
jgi:hypothetical protein